MFKFLSRGPASPPRTHADLPRVLWIELTSKCPFNCVFCSRRLRWGGGRHMDFQLYGSIIEDLRQPEIIRLNYSGESTHHPRLVDAVRLANRTGATTELVTALASLPNRLIEGLATSGLDRLTLSLHTMDPEQYKDIYGYGSLAEVQHKVAALTAARDRAGASGPSLDLAVVAMERNLSQLNAIAHYAVQIGATGLAIHPVIRRDPISETFAAELDGERLRPRFLTQLRERLAEVARRYPDLTLSVSTPETQPHSPMGERPAPYPWPLPPGGRIQTCDQNPWDTVHILADGSVVTCEVRDGLVMGRISAGGARLSDIWHGPIYESFRANYRAGRADDCKACPYKIAFQDTPLRAAIEAGHGASAQLLHGWHPADGSGVHWAKRRAVLRLARPARARRLSLAGLAPPAAGRIEVRVEGRLVTRLGGDSAEGWLARDLKLPRGLGDEVLIEFVADRSFVPAREGLGPDIRELGFGLTRIRLD